MDIMTTKSYYPIMTLVYIVALLLIILINEILLIIFVMIVLLMYQVVWFGYYQNSLKEETNLALRELEYKLNKTLRYRDETRKQFISLSEVLGSGLIRIDEQERIKEINSYAKNTFNLVDCIDQEYDVLKDHKSLYNLIHEAYLSEKETRGQIVFNDRYYDINSAPIFDRDLYQGCLILIHDITQIKNAETFQKQFTADVTHELKTPLSALKGISEILLRDQDMDKEKRHEFDRIVFKESQRLETILNDLLIISKMDRLDYELDIKQVNIKQLFEEIIHLLEAQADAKGLIIESDIAEDTIAMDPLKMQQVLLNLVKNAISYSDKGTITIKGYIEANHYCVEVIDTGIGIKKADQEKVFKRFYRVDEARSRASGGSGLGLSIIKNVILKHHGSIDLKSKLGEGSCFKICIPRVQEIR